MTSPDSIYSGSAESRSIIYTPESSPYDNYFNTPLNLRLSPGDSSFAGGWGALPSRLLDSPELEMARPYHPHPTARKLRAQGELGGKIHGQLGITRGYMALADGRNMSFDSMSILPPPQQPEPGDGACRQVGFLGHDLQSTVSEIPQWAVAPTRHLKIAGIPPTATSLMLFNRLSVSSPIPLEGRSWLTMPKGIG
jgi:hypothetical protein